MKKPFSTSNVTTLISKATEITGDVHFSGALEIEGRVFGNIYAEDDGAAQVRIRETGLVRGDIHAPRIIINGVVEGDVYSNNHIELAARARVKGNINYTLIEMVMGSEVNGSLCHKSADDLQTRRLTNDNAVVGIQPAYLQRAAQAGGPSDCEQGNT